MGAGTRVRVGTRVPAGLGEGVGVATTAAIKSRVGSAGCVHPAHNMAPAPAITIKRHTKSPRWVGYCYHKRNVIFRGGTSQDVGPIDCQLRECHHLVKVMAKKGESETVLITPSSPENVGGLLLGVCRLAGETH